MLSIDEALALADPAAVVEQIHDRKKLRAKMVGDLYPNILVNEVGRLVTLYKDLGGEHLADDLYRATVDGEEA